MKKIFLFLTLITIGLSGFTQTPKIEKLKKELKNHPKQDTFRVKRLNDLSGNQYLPWEQKEKYADEALVISKKINYKAGRGNALALLATVKFLENKLEEGKLLLLEADSISRETGDLKLKTIVLRRMSSFVTDAKEKERLLNNADSFAKKSKDPFFAGTCTCNYS